MIRVVDASVAVKWFLDAQEDHVEKARVLLRTSASGAIEFWQPPHFLGEVAAVLCRLAPERAKEDLALLSALEITWAEPSEAMARAIDLSRRLDHHLFDTWYHALALARPGARLVTADRRYYEKARHLGRIDWLADWDR